MLTPGGLEFPSTESADIAMKRKSVGLPSAVAGISQQALVRRVVPIPACPSYCSCFSFKSIILFFSVPVPNLKFQKQGGWLVGVEGWWGVRGS